MRIAILGSWKLDRTGQMQRTREEFAAACEEIGRELARQHQVVIVGSESANTADLHVVNGMLSVIAISPDNSSRIEVIRASDEKQPFYEVAQKYPKYISYPPITGDRWTDVHLMQIKDADAVLTIGGLDGTYHAGLAAIVARKVLVPIGTFGGASKRLAATLLSEGTPSRAELASLSNPWTSHVLDTAAGVLGIRRQPRILIIHGRSDDRYKLSEWLRVTLGLSDILIMQQEFGGGLSLPEKFEKLATRADGAIAVATPDDSVVSPEGVSVAQRARQNVWLELGWIWGRMGRGKVMLLSKGKLEHPSDIQGLEYYTYTSSPVEASESIRSFIAQLSVRG
jgi:hypothetical protein